MTASRWSLPEQLHSYVRGREATVTLGTFARVKQAVWWRFTWLPPVDYLPVIVSYWFPSWIKSERNSLMCVNFMFMRVVILHFLKLSFKCACNRQWPVVVQKSWIQAFHPTNKWNIISLQEPLEPKANSGTGVLTTQAMMAALHRSRAGGDGQQGYFCNGIVLTS